MTWLSVGPAASSRSGTASSSSQSNMSLPLSAFSSSLSKSRTFRHKTWRQVQIYSKDHQVSKCSMRTLNLIWKTTVVEDFLWKLVYVLALIATYRAKAEFSKKFPALLARSAAVVLAGRRCGKSITHKLSLDNPTKLPPGKKDRSHAPDPNFLVIAHPHLLFTTKTMETKPTKHLASMLHAPIKTLAFRL